MLKLQIGNFFTRDEVARILQVNPPTVHKYAKQGKFREFKQHKNCTGLYPKEDIEEFIKKYFSLDGLNLQSHLDNRPTTA